MKHSIIGDDIVFSVDTFDKFLERKIQEWKENNSEGYMTLQEDGFDAEHNHEEQERLLEESEYEEVKKQA